MMKTRSARLFFSVLLLAFTAPPLLRADYRVEKQLKLEPGGHLVVDSSEGSVRVTGSTESGARVIVTANRDDIDQLFDFSYEEHAGQVKITARRRHPWGWNWGHGINLHFEVTIPEETSVEVKTGGGSVEVSRIKRETELNTSGGSIRASGLGANLRAHTSGGGIKLEDVRGTARVDTSGGDIRAESLGGSLDARTSGGSIELSEVKGDLLAHTSGGSIRVSDAGGRVDADTSGGSVEVSFARGNSRGGEVESSGGGVRVRLDPSANLNLDASSSAGPVINGLPIRVSGTLSRSHLVGDIGSGGALLKVHSSGGSVHIESL
jgi:Putative adhesin